jgi:hypothetical protein
MWVPIGKWLTRVVSTTDLDARRHARSEDRDAT